MDVDPAALATIRLLSQPHEPMGTGPTPKIFWTTDSELLITSVSGARVDLDLHRVIGQELVNILRQSDAAYPPLAMHYEALSGRIGTCTVELVGHILECHVQPSRAQDGTIIGTIGVAVDVTELRHLQTEMLRQNAYLTALHQITLSVIHRLDVDELLRDIVARASELVGTEHGYIYLLNEDYMQLEVKVGVGLFSSMIGHRCRPGEGLAGKVFNAREPMVVDNYHQWSGRSRVFDSSPGYVRAVAGVPLGSGSSIVGVLGLAYTDSAKVFGAEDLDVLTKFASLTSLALDNARLFTLTKQELEMRTASEEMLREQAYRDSLTGLPNRRYFMERLRTAMSAVGAQSEPVAVLFLDLDNFKTVNDTMGHDAGDELLVEVARRLARCLRHDDAAARLGGDEFGIILQGSAESERAEEVAQRLLVCLRDPVQIHDRSVAVSLSVGISVGTPGQVTPSQMLRRADISMYRAKHAGRDRYGLHNDVIDTATH